MIRSNAQTTARADIRTAIESLESASARCAAAKKREEIAREALTAWREAAQHAAAYEAPPWIRVGPLVLVIAFLFGSYLDWQFARDGLEAWAGLEQAHTALILLAASSFVFFELFAGFVAGRLRREGHSIWAAVVGMAALTIPVVVALLLYGTRLASRELDLLDGLDPAPGDTQAAGKILFDAALHAIIVAAGVLWGPATIDWMVVMVGDRRLERQERAAREDQGHARREYIDAYRGVERTLGSGSRYPGGLSADAVALGREIFGEAFDRGPFGPSANPAPTARTN